MKLAAVAVIAGCAASPAAPVAPSPPSSAAAEPIADPCKGAEYRQLDFWTGDWTLAVHARKQPGSEEWRDTTGIQHITRTLKGCAIEENFTAAPPIQFSGRSFSTYDAIAKKWRQTWVDDSGSYLAFTGGPEADGFALYGEPRDLGGKKFQMRMVWSKITHDALRWEWQRSEDSWATSTVMIAIDYARVAAR
jgi:hypothetical protein